MIYTQMDSLADTGSVRLSAVRYKYKFCGHQLQTTHNGGWNKIRGQDKNLEPYHKKPESLGYIKLQKDGTLRLDGQKQVLSPKMVKK